MRKYLLYLLTISLSFLFCGCKDDEDNPDNQYYVKYEADVKSVYIGNTITYTVNTDKGTQTYQSGKSFSETYGPVKKGFKASVTADATNWHAADCEARIYVSRGSEPFVLKAYKSGGKTVTISYKVDY